MKIIKNQNVEEIIGVSKENRFKISEDSQDIVIHSLINLYSDPIGSVVREITSNCIDAHRERDLKVAGKVPLNSDDDKKFWSNRKTIEIEYIDKNTILGIEASIVFKDFGVGLSNKRVQEIFTVFGASTKRDNNLEIGGFGLGAKSPLAYNETFYVKTNHNGREYYYMIYINNDDVPSMDLVRESLTGKELNGTEIIIPIKETWRDKDDFKGAIQKQIMYFENIVFKNIEEAIGNLKKPNVLGESENWLIDGEGVDSGILVGKVKYPIDWKILYKDEYTMSHIKYNLLIKFDIGVLDLVPSREALRYTPRTIKLIKNKIDGIIQEFKNDAKAELEQEQDIIKYIQKTSQIRNDVYYRNREGFSDLDSCKAVLANLKKADVKFRGEEALCDKPFYRSFRGFEFYVVRLGVNSNAVGGKSVQKTKISEFSKFQGIEIFYNVEDTYSRLKDISLCRDLETEPVDAFVQFKIKSITDEDIRYETTNYKISATNVKNGYKKIKEWLLESPSIKSYDDYTPNTDIKEEEGEILSNQERRKLEGKVFARELYPVEYPDKYKSDNCKFENIEYDTEVLDKFIDDKDDSLIVYGFSNESAELSKLGCLMSCSKELNHRGWKGFKDNKIIKILKISKSLEKFFKNRHERITSIEQFYMDKHPLLIKFCTGYIVQNLCDETKYLAKFNKINKYIYDVWQELNEYAEKHFKHSEYISDDLHKEIISLCSNLELLDPNMMSRCDIIKEYTSNIDLLRWFEPLSGYNSLTDEQKVWLKDFLDIKDKKHSIAITEDDQKKMENKSKLIV